MRLICAERWDVWEARERCVARSWREREGDACLDSRAWMRVVRVLVWVLRRGRSRLEVRVWRWVRRVPGRLVGGAIVEMDDFLDVVVGGCGGGGVSAREEESDAMVCGRVGIVRWRYDGLVEGETTRAMASAESCRERDMSGASKGRSSDRCESGGCAKSRAVESGVGGSLRRGGRRTRRSSKGSGRGGSLEEVRVGSGTEETAEAKRWRFAALRRWAWSFWDS